MELKSSHSTKWIKLNFFLRSVSAYISLGLLLTIEHFYTWIEKVGSFILWRDIKHIEGYISSRKEYFYLHRVINRIEDSWNRPICSSPGRTFRVMNREIIGDKLEIDGTSKECMNLGSYNYLGFASTQSPCQKDVLNCLERYSVCTSSSRLFLGSDLINKLEEEVAKKTGKESALVFSMGFGTNVHFISYLAKKGDLILSDEKNHSSIINGCFASNASVKVFGHNDVEKLENMVIQAIVRGQPRTHRPWNRIFIFVEGLYSMEGYYPKIKEIVRIKKIYKCYLFIDEAHSFGVIGKTGGGICEKFEINRSDVDIIMGTFTKSYAAFGGFIASNKGLISDVRENCPGFRNSHSLPPVVCQQILSAMKITSINKNIITEIHFKSNYFRKRLIDEGFDVLGSEDSPIVVLLIGSPFTAWQFSRCCLKRNLAVVVVGFPATAFSMARARFCVSNAHSMKDLDYAIDIILEVADLTKLKTKKRIFG